MSEETTAYIADTLLGLFAVTGEIQLIEFALYPEDANQIAAAMKHLDDGETTRELRRLLESLEKRGFRRIILSDRYRANAARKITKISVESQANSKQITWIKRNIIDFAKNVGVNIKQSSLLKLSHEVSMVSASNAVQRAQSEHSKTVSQMIQLINELDKTLNVLSSKLREWHGLHFPELGRQVDSHVTYARLVVNAGERSMLTKDILDDLGVKTRQASIILRRARNSMGAPLNPDDLAAQKSLAENVISLYGYRDSLEGHISATTMEIAPNLSQVAGPVLAGKLIEKAGSLKKLAMLPSSSLQVLGAEKALYRSKKTSAKPPKHGLIFQHPYVHSKHRRERGKAARFLSSKLSLAARADAFSGNPIGAELRRQLGLPELVTSDQ
jgi:nucleolar protein 56